MQREGVDLDRRAALAAPLNAPWRTLPDPCAQAKLTNRLGPRGINHTDVTMVSGGGAKAVDLGEMTMDGFITTIQSEIDAAAASATKDIHNVRT
jgi:hypothetical protein